MKLKTPAAPVAVKFVDGSDDTIEGLILPWGGPAGGRDLTGTMFVKDVTDFCLDWFPDGGRPGLFRHGFDKALKASVVGREIGGRDDEKGHWLQAQLDKSNEYWGEIKELVDAGKLFMSSGSVDHLVDVDAKTGAIRSWPWVEWSLVPNPANPDQPAVREAFKASEAAEDASTMAYAIASLTYNLGNEDDPAQQDRIKAMITLGQEYIAAEIAEVGTPEDMAETIIEQLSLATTAWLSLDAATKEGKRNSSSDSGVLQAAHDGIAAVLGLDCASTTAGGDKSADPKPTPASAVKAGNDVEPATPEQLAAVRELLADVLPRVNLG
jgi:hypothetical protein